MHTFDLQNTKHTAANLGHTSIWAFRPFLRHLSEPLRLPTLRAIQRLQLGPFPKLDQGLDAQAGVFAPVAHVIPEDTWNSWRRSASQSGRKHRSFGRERWVVLPEKGAALGRQPGAARLKFVFQGFIAINEYVSSFRRKAKLTTIPLSDWYNMVSYDIILPLTNACCMVHRAACSGQTCVQGASNDESIGMYTMTKFGSCMHVFFQSLKLKEFVLSFWSRAPHLDV